MSKEINPDPIEGDKAFRLVAIFASGVFTISGAAYVAGQELLAATEYEIRMSSQSSAAIQYIAPLNSFTVEADQLFQY